MAKIIKNTSSHIPKPKTKGLAAKTKSSNTKSSKLYKKSYKGQGR
jgi:predicted metallopeptidase|tara:strand:- start:401 stop:535 length:135 start_codon:yes stop_codon:yes gene_type:complete